MGDIEETMAIEALKELPFTERKVVMTRNLLSTNTKQRDQGTTNKNQWCKPNWNLAYQTNVYYDQPERFSLMVFNGLFGGFPSLQTFMNVREKKA